MHGPILRILLGTFFVVLLATPMMLKRLTERQEGTGAAQEPAAVMARYGFFLQEVAKLPLDPLRQLATRHASGIEAEHEPARLSVLPFHGSRSLDGFGVGKVFGPESREL